MKFVLLLLTAMAATTSALQISGMITGMHDPTTKECPPEQVDMFFETCVVGTLRDYGIPVGRRLQELRGDADRELINLCTGCPSNPRPYSFCWLWNCRRRLIVVEDHHEERFLGAKANIVNDILVCLETDIPAFPCLGSVANLNFDMIVVTE